MGNGGYINPIYTSSSYHFWIRRNLIVMNSGKLKFKPIFITNN
jgi:hypothetical protein